MHALSVIKDIVKQQVIRSYGYALCNSSYFHYSRTSITDASHDEVPKHNFVFAKSTETIAKWNACVILTLEFLDLLGGLEISTVIRLIYQYVALQWIFLRRSLLL